jgi:hypothetical protein
MYPDAYAAASGVVRRKLLVWHGNSTAVVVNEVGTQANISGD